jgi:holo-[acyl-carrier protein] synthase
LIVGVGVDIVDLEDFRARLTDDLIQELFLPDEISYSSSRARPWESYAARFAAKEAVMKALGAGLSQGLSWKDVEVRREESGELGLRMTGAALERARGRGAASSRLSVAHSRRSAVAVVVLEDARGAAREDA